ncbi:hypothetical protein [Pseudarthrobacter sulfonivorans]|uniref:hypothetical protein n=1 Tax=Pseudarthrobacter sulfonivorans TaxID=121292 RepID=UPI00168A95D5|nr:hypothetical protein [Pseudarthrobacter sulfonivorans]
MLSHWIRVLRTKPHLPSTSQQDIEPPKVDETPGKPPAGVWVAVSGALAVVVSIVAALGLQEDFLRRMVRNDPEGTAWSITAVIVGAALPVILLLFPRTQRATPVVTIFSAVIIVAGMIGVLQTGARSLHSRDMPSLSLSAAKSSSGAVTVTSEATAAALRSTEKMLLRIYGIGSSAGEDSTLDPCRESSFPSLDVPPTGSRVLQWGEAGPDRTGTAKVSDNLVIAGDKFTFVCAYAALSGGEIREGDFFAASLLDLRTLTSTTTEPKPTPTPTTP